MSIKIIEITDDAIYAYEHKKRLMCVVNKRYSQIGKSGEYVGDYIGVRADKTCRSGSLYKGTPLYEVILQAAIDHGREVGR